MKWLDRITEQSTRAIARRSSRRSVLSGIGTLLVGAAALPLLPVARGAEGPGHAQPAGGRAADPGDPAACDYWRHCAIDGFLCSCCGGTQSTCPPGTEMSAITWIGTCHNPGDGKDYVISYNDCCGKTGCGRCFCNRNEGDTPLYQPGRSNDYNWCSGSSHANIPYHCSTARIVGAAE
ncbi:MAG: methylamine dehydrogenase (amicyanin) light chain [Proteobacteria bacterium]|nr:methylamine dehydrogenase (amicyanin) light chain [Pseudomonadota bacterium]